MDASGRARRAPDITPQDYAIFSPDGEKLPFDIEGKSPQELINQGFEDLGSFTLGSDPGQLPAVKETIKDYMKEMNKDMEGKGIDLGSDVFDNPKREAFHNRVNRFDEGRVVEIINALEKGERLDDAAYDEMIEAYPHFKKRRAKRERELRRLSRHADEERSRRADLQRRRQRGGAHEVEAVSRGGGVRELDRLKQQYTEEYASMLAGEYWKGEEIRSAERRRLVQQQEEEIRRVIEEELELLD